MPELPDITIYVEALRERLLGQPLAGVQVVSPFLLRTFDPPVESLAGRRVTDVSRLGKRLVLRFAEPDAVFLVLHLMIAGRLRWLRPAARGPARITLATLEFPTGTLAVTEAGSKKRAALHVVSGAEALAKLDPGGLEVLDAEQTQFAAALRRENRTLKRALTDPRLFAGIGNAYSDEILHAARLSPVMLTSRLNADQVACLFHAAQETLQRWIARRRGEFAGRFPGPGEITALRPDFTVHGRFGQPCPVCGTRVQRVRYAENEANYCPTCQTSGRVLADRSLSRLLRDDWPRTVADWESSDAARAPWE